MLWNRKFLPGFAFLAIITGMPACPSQAGIGCPPTYAGKPLKGVGLFSGPPEDKVQLMPKPGYFIVPQRPRELWEKYPASTLGCKYQGTDEIITVELPRDIRICEFPDYPEVNCH